MYEYINGTLAEIAPAYAVVDAGSVGYFINISLHTFSEIEKLESVKLFLHHIVREDAELLHAGEGFLCKPGHFHQAAHAVVQIQFPGGNCAVTVAGEIETDRGRTVEVHLLRHRFDDGAVLAAAEAVDGDDHLVHIRKIRFKNFTGNG